MNRLTAFALLVICLGTSALFFYWSDAQQADSIVIEAERNHLAKLQDPARIKNEPGYAPAIKMRLRDLDYLLAKAYIKENLPDAAIAVLKKMISDEDANKKHMPRRRSRSCMEEARCYEALREAYTLKNDRAGAEKADRYREQLIAQARTEKKREQLEEGTSLRLVYGD